MITPFFQCLPISNCTTTEIPEDTRAIWRRMIIVEFPHVFDGEKRDPYVIDKITSPTELSGLLNKVLTLIPDLKKKADLTYSKTLEDTRNKYMLVSDPVKSFLEERIENTDWAVKIKKELVYQAFIAFCTENKIPAVGKKKFGRTLLAMHYKDDRDSWLGIYIKDNENGQ